ITVTAVNLDPRDSIAMVDATIDAYVAVSREVEGQSDQQRDQTRRSMQQSLAASVKEIQDHIDALIKPYEAGNLTALADSKRREVDDLAAKVTETKVQLQQASPTAPPEITRPEELAFKYRDPPVAQ